MSEAIDDLRVALELADAADAITRARWGSQLQVSAKTDRSLVTDVDDDVEQAMRAILAARCPGDSIVGEEGGGTADSARVWLLDPLDHTNNYARGLPAYGTLIACRHDGALTAGVVTAPSLGQRWWAAAGQGAHNTVGPLRVSQVDRLDDAYVSFAALHKWDELGRTGALVDLCRTVRYTTGSGGFEAQMLVAEGKLDIALDPWGQPWDHAAVELIVHEAGGRMTSVTGVPGHTNGNAVVTNGLLHDATLAVLSRRPRGAA